MTKAATRFLCRLKFYGIYEGSVWRDGPDLVNGLVLARVVYAPLRPHWWCLLGTLSTSAPTIFAIETIDPVV